MDTTGEEGKIQVNLVLLYVFIKSNSSVLQK